MEIAVDRDVDTDQPRAWILRRRNISAPAPRMTTPEPSSATVSAVLELDAGVGTPVFGAPEGTVPTCLPSLVGVGTEVGVACAWTPDAAVGVGVDVVEPPSARAVPAPPRASTEAQAIAAAKDRVRMGTSPVVQPGAVMVTTGPGSCDVHRMTRRLNGSACCKRTANSRVRSGPRARRAGDRSAWFDPVLLVVSERTSETAETHGAAGQVRRP
jgi:hypothetical protein